MECSSFVQFAGGGDEAVVVVHYFFDDRQADARAGVFIFAMKFLKYLKDLGAEFFLKTNAIVRYGDMAVVFVW